MKLASSYLKAPVTPGVEAAPAVTPLPEPVIHCGLESYDLSIVPSMEEVAISMSESDAALNQIQEDLGHVSRLEDQAEGLSTLADVSERVESAEPSTLALIDVAAELATVGTDVNSDEHLVGGLEAFAGLSVGTEAVGNMREMAKKFIDALVAILKRIWESAKQFYKELTDQLKICVRQASDVELQAKEANGKSPSAEKVEIPRRIAAQLVLRNKAARSGSDLVGFVNSHKKAAVVMLDSVASELITAGKQITAILKSTYNASTGYGDVAGSFTRATDLIADKLKPLAGSDPRFPAQSKVFVLEGTLGNSELFLVTGTSTNSATFKTLPVSPNVEIATSIKPTTPQEAAVIADTVKEICGMIEQYRTAAVPVLEGTSAAMRDAVKAGNPAAKSSADNGSDDLNSWKAAGSYVSAYANLANSGTGRFVSQTLKTLMALNKTCKLSLDLYA